MKATEEKTPTREQMLADMSAIAKRIRAVQQERGLSDRALLDEFPDLGSAKTWKDRLLSESFESLNVRRWWRALQRVAMILDGGTPEGEFYGDLPFVREMHGRLLKLERQQSDRRILCCLAANGTGKSVFARWAVSQSRSSRAMIRIRPSWKNKVVHLCAGMARALGDDGTFSSPSAAEDAVIRHLSGHPRTLFVDQAHEGGVALMHLLRAFVDETPSRFVYLAYDTAYRQVMSASTDAMIEAQAFMGRCLKPVFDRYRAGTRPEDVSYYLQEAAGVTRAAADSLGAKVSGALQRHTNLRLLDDAISAARVASGEDSPPAELIREKVYVLGSLDPRQFESASEELE